MKKAVIFSCLGLGDGLIALVLSHNLHLNGYTTTTFHPSLSSLQSWFPHLPLSSFPQDANEVLEKADRIFIFFEKSPHMLPIFSSALQSFRSKTTILNPIATENKDYPYWEEGQFNGKKTFVDNLYTFCQNLLHLPICTKSNGITPLPHLIFRKKENRILMHPTSSRPGKNWDPDKFVALAQQLKEKGYDPQWILSKEERKHFPTSSFPAPLFDSLGTLAHYIYESGLLIGNDSGPGHLASCLNIPTVTLFCNRKASLFWKPGWGSAQALCPSPWIPNLKCLRLRDRYWQKWISVSSVIRSLEKSSSGKFNADKQPG